MHSKFEVSTSSRINKAIFIQTVDKSVYRIVLALENMTVNMYDLDGKQVMDYGSNIMKALIIVLFLENRRFRRYQSIVTWED